MQDPRIIETGRGTAHGPRSQHQRTTDRVRRSLVLTDPRGPSPRPYVGPFGRH